MKQFVLCCAAFLAAACWSHAAEVEREIEIRKNFRKSVRADSIFKLGSFVNLSATDSSLMRDPRKMVLAQQTLYVSDGRAIFQFTPEGRFIRKLDRKGRGPQEYSNVMDFVVAGDRIHLVDVAGKLLTYTTDNRFVASAELDFTPATLHPLSDGSLLLTSSYRTAGDKFHVYDSRTLKRQSSFGPIDKAELTYRHVMFPSNLFQYGSKLRYHEPMNNDVYELTARPSTIAYRFDFYGRNPPETFWRRSYADVMDFNQQAIREKYCFGIPLYAESRNSLLVSYRDTDRYLMAHYSKRTGRSVQFETIRFFDRMDPVPIEEIFFFFVSDQCMIIALPCHLFFDENGKIRVPELATILTNNGNPVTCVVELK